MKVFENVRMILTGRKGRWKDQSGRILFNFGKLTEDGLYTKIDISAYRNLYFSVYWVLSEIIYKGNPKKSTYNVDLKKITVDDLFRYYVVTFHTMCQIYFHINKVQKEVVLHDMAILNKNLGVERFCYMNYDLSKPFDLGSYSSDFDQLLKKQFKIESNQMFPMITNSVALTFGLECFNLFNSTKSDPLLDFARTRKLSLK